MVPALSMSRDRAPGQAEPGRPTELSNTHLRPASEGPGDVRGIHPPHRPVAHRRPATDTPDSTTRTRWRTAMTSPTAGAQTDAEEPVHRYRESVDISWAARTPRFLLRVGLATERIRVFSCTGTALSGGALDSGIELVAVAHTRRPWACFGTRAHCRARWAVHDKTKTVEILEGLSRAKACAESDLLLYARCSFPFVSSICSWSGCSAGWPSWRAVTPPRTWRSWIYAMRSRSCSGR